MRETDTELEKGGDYSTTKVLHTEYSVRNADSGKSHKGASFSVQLGVVITDNRYL